MQLQQLVSSLQLSTYLPPSLPPSLPTSLIQDSRAPLAADCCISRRPLARSSTLTGGQVPGRHVSSPCREGGIAHSTSADLLKQDLGVV